MAEIIEHIFANFWKNMCEARLLPITTDFFPTDKDLKDQKVYYREETNL